MVTGAIQMMSDAIVHWAPENVRVYMPVGQISRVVVTPTSISIHMADHWQYRFFGKDADSIANQLGLGLKFPEKGSE